jgi:hypothetical protein
MEECLENFAWSDKMEEKGKGDGVVLSKAN